ncbi:ATP-binding cassette transporter [Syncephalis plumigaleata]|nr:ATP-binding cassette transporter [Syncephalis plumigaleata]
MVNTMSNIDDNVEMSTHAQRAFISNESAYESMDIDNNSNDASDAHSSNNEVDHHATIHDVSHEHPVSSLTKTVTAKSNTSAMLTEDQATALQMAKAREELRAREERRKQREEERRKRGFLQKLFGKKSNDDDESEATNDEDKDEKHRLLLGSFTDYGKYSASPGGATAEQRAALDHDVRELVIQLTVLGVISFIAAYLQQSMWMISGENQTSELRRRYFASIIRQEISWFDVTPTGDLTSRITGDVNLIQTGISEKLGVIIHSLSTFLAGFIIAFVKGWRLALVLLSAFPLLAIAGAIMGSVIAKTVSGGQDAYAKAVSAFGAQEREVRRYESKLDMALAKGKKKGYIVGISTGLTMCIVFASYGLGFWFGSTRIASGEMTVEDMLSVFYALITGTMTLTARGAASKIFSVIDRASVIDYRADGGLLPDNISGNIEIRDVNFSYPSRPDVQILRDYNLDIKSGQTVALVGSSGSGKSTIVSLLERFYNPDTGSIKIDGIPIQDINLRHLRRHIGLVGQEPILFQTTIKQNILWGCSYGDGDANEPTRNKWKKLVGYDTLVGEKGALLSGGQKQRIAIARALVRNPRILLLDEATSALDTESEKLVQDALDRAASGRTTIVIAHRLSTIRDADKIVVMNRGKIYETAIIGRWYDKVDSDDEGPVDPDAVVLDVEQPLTKQLTYAKTKDTVMSERDVEEVRQHLREERNKQATPFRRVMRLNRPEFRYIILGIIGAIVDGAIFPAYSILISKILEALMNTNVEQMRKDADFWSLMFVVVGLISFISAFCRNGMFAISGEHLIHRIRKLTFATLLRQEMGFFDDRLHSTGVLCAKLSTEAEMVNGLAGAAIGTFVQVATILIIGLAIAFYYGWKMTFVVVAFTPVMIVANIFATRMQFDLNKKTKKAYEQSASIACEAVEHIRTVASLGREDTFLSQYNEAIKGPHALSVRTALISSISVGASQPLQFIMIAVALYYGSRLILSGEYDSSQVLMVMFSVFSTAMGVAEVSGFASSIAKAKIAALEIFELLDRVSEIDPTDPNGKVADKFTGEVTAESVHFRYPARKNVKVLRGIDLTVPQGKTIALVGSSGCGKSTMVGLIERFYDTEKGQVNVDGLETRDWQLSKLRSEIALVGQEPVLFDMSVAENIAYGKPDATIEEIHQAARDANIYDFVSSLPDGFDTGVGERGSQLSGGQKQRVAIARAIIRNPHVQEALDRAAVGRTTISIAHRLSTIQDADIIYVFKDGRILEHGKHNELLRNKGLYYALVQKQSLERKKELES